MPASGPRYQVDLKLHVDGFETVPDRKDNGNLAKTSLHDSTTWRQCAGADLKSTTQMEGPSKKKSQNDADKDDEPGNISSEADVTGRLIQTKKGSAEETDETGSPGEVSDSPMSSERAENMRHRVARLLRHSTRNPSRHPSHVEAQRGASTAPAPPAPAAQTSASSTSNAPLLASQSFGNLYETSSPRHSRENISQGSCYTTCNCERLDAAVLGSYVTRSIEEYSGQSAPDALRQRRKHSISPSILDIIANTMAASPASAAASTSSTSTQSLVQPVQQSQPPPVQLVAARSSASQTATKPVQKPSSPVRSPKRIVAPPVEPQQPAPVRTVSPAPVSDSVKVVSAPQNVYNPPAGFQQQQPPQQQQQLQQLPQHPLPICNGVMNNAPPCCMMRAQQQQQQPMMMGPPPICYPYPDANYSMSSPGVWMTGFEIRCWMMLFGFLLAIYLYRMGLSEPRVCPPTR